MNANLSEQEIALVRLLQEEFPLCERPFAILGERLHLDEDEVLSMTQRLHREGKLKRIAAALYHRSAGYLYNAMVVWDVPEERLDEAAKAAIELAQVSHCYSRNPQPNFNYNLYTMIHETSKERLADLLSELESRIKPNSFQCLRTCRELKKVGMKYFLKE